MMLAWYAEQGVLEVGDRLVAEVFQQVEHPVDHPDLGRLYLSLISRFSGNLFIRHFELSIVETRHGSGLPAPGGVNTCYVYTNPRGQGSDKLAIQLVGIPMRHEHDIFSGCCIPPKISALRLAPVS
jgi:hypothetical protein